ncbi:MAG TPA: hypothetical protein VLG37_00685 [Candidatus Saccharimonadales bacterium]|nr:hypothetical protein [Candidatus Saccharimonadales bacterium]
MAKLIIVIGLPGSGKSHYLRKLKADKLIWAFYDDYQNKAYGKDPDPRLSRHYGPLLSRLKKGKTMAISDIRYCREPELDWLLKSVLDVLPETELELHYFENKPEAAIKNIKQRTNPQAVEVQLKFVQENSPNYIIPKIKKIPIYSLLK